jgi:hypothetical protein
MWLVMITLIAYAVTGFSRKSDKEFIKKSGETYEIYKEGVLILEFNAKNTDSASLETLEYIYETYNE